MSDVKLASLAIAGLIAFVLLSIGGFMGCKEMTRYQKRADAKNKTLVTKQEIRTAQQKVHIVEANIGVTKAEAEMRRQEAYGIRDAQDAIAATLTPLYVQHEAIQKLPQAKAVYIPSGAQGIPQVYDVKP